MVNRRRGSALLKPMPAETNNGYRWDNPPRSSTTELQMSYVWSSARRTITPLPTGAAEMHPRWATSRPCLLCMTWHHAIVRISSGALARAMVGGHRHAAPDRPGTVRYTHALVGMERSGRELPACLTDRLSPALPVTGRYRNHHSRLRCRVQREGRQAHGTCNKPRQANAT